MIDGLHRPAHAVAPDLIGAELIRGPVHLRITEVEAYGGPEDSASHARFGCTPRNAPMWGEAGHAYVYLCYGIHWMLNVVVGKEGEAGAVLVRSCEVLAGQSVVEERRGRSMGPDLLAGPGKVGQALNLGRGDSGQRFGRRRWGGRPGMWLRPSARPVPVCCGPRFGIAYAEALDQARDWRFAAAESRAVSHPQALRST